MRSIEIPCPGLIDETTDELRALHLRALWAHRIEDMAAEHRGWKLVSLGWDGPPRVHEPDAHGCWLATEGLQVLVLAPEVLVAA